MAWQPFRVARSNRIWRFVRISRLLFTTLWILTRERNRVVRARARGENDVRPNIEVLRAAIREFRITAIALGGLLIKLGQFLSARADILPPEALAELTQLQDEVPAEPFAAIELAIEHDLHAPLSTIFAWIDPAPAGSASLGQVHHGYLLDGREVAIKVQRPGIEAIVRADLGAIRFVLEVVRRFVPAADSLIDLRALYREFSRTVYEELDYQREGRNAERFARLFAEQPDIRVPKVIWDYTQRHVLMLEWMDGIKVSDVAALDAARVDRSAVAKVLIDSYLKQVLQVGYFHADPHPGNIFVQPTPDGFILIYLDFGMMGSITTPMKRAMRDVLVGAVQLDATQIVRGVDALGFLGESTDRRAVEQALSLLLDRFGRLPFGELREIDQTEVLMELETLLYGQAFRLPAQFAFLGRAVGMLVGVATTLAPNFNALDSAAPYARQILGEDGPLTGVLRLLGVEDARDLGTLLAREGVGAVRSLAAIPRLAERVLAQVERGELRVVLETSDLSPRETAQFGGRLTSSVLSRPVPVWVPLSVAGVAVATLLVRRRRNGV